MTANELDSIGDVQLLRALKWVSARIAGEPLETPTGLRIGTERGRQVEQRLIRREPSALPPPFHERPDGLSICAIKRQGCAQSPVI